MLTCWGGQDDYRFEFEPENIASQPNGISNNNYNNNNVGEAIMTTDENDNTTAIIPGKKVRIKPKAFQFVLIDFVPRIV